MGGYKHGGWINNRHLYTVWSDMLSRCRNTNHKQYKDYGGRGITVCEEWKDFPTFREWAFATGYVDGDNREKCTIDRIDPNGNYEPSNCRWASVRGQANNKQGTLWIEYGGERMQLSYWAERLGLPYHTLYDRLHRYGWSVERAFTEPVRRAL